ncbi:MAG: glutathione S-transferase family protein [Pseudooceanicola sp.]|nr:glutathione S-transferase family protein [Pseudooceanicola sp.]
MKLHVFPPSPNSRKVMVVNALLGLNLPLVPVDLRTGAQKSAEFMAINPNAKTPVLELDDGSGFWESNAIINRLCSGAKTDLWPADERRYDIMRWQFWEASHWTPACSKFIAKNLFGAEGIDMAAAEADFARFATVLDGVLEGRDWLVGDGMTTADISVGAPLCLRGLCHYPMKGYANIDRWIARLEALPAWQQVDAAMQAAA